MKRTCTQKSAGFFFNTFNKCTITLALSELPLQFKHKTCQKEIKKVSDSFNLISSHLVCEIKSRSVFACLKYNRLQVKIVLILHSKCIFFLPAFPFLASGNSRDRSVTNCLPLSPQTVQSRFGQKQLYTHTGP